MTSVGAGGGGGGCKLKGVGGFECGSHEGTCVLRKRQGLGFDAVGLSWILQTEFQL